MAVPANVREKKIELDSATYVPLRDYFEQRLLDLEKRMELQAASADVALTLATRIIDKRLEGMNNFREQLREQAATFITRENYDARQQILQVQVDTLRMAQATHDGKASQLSVNIVFVISVLSLVMTGFTTFIQFFKFFK